MLKLVLWIAACALVCSARAYGAQAGDLMMPTRDTDLCPAVETVGLIASLRSASPDQAAEVGTGAHCVLAMSADTIKILGGAAAIYKFVSPGPNGTVVIEMTTQDVHMIGYAAAADFAPAPR